MKRHHREIAGGEVAMMAVITKAMGAFLILMIMLLPYYTGDTQSQGTVDETRQHIDEARKGLDAAMDTLKRGRLSDPEIDDLLKQLMQAQEQLTTAQNLVTQLRIKVDQAASQINRLEQQNAGLQAQVVTLHDRNAELQTELDALKKELERLRAIDTTALQARIRELEAAVAAWKAEAARIPPLLDEVARLQDRNAKLQAKLEALEKELERLRAIDPTALHARIRELEAQAARLKAEADKVPRLEKLVNVQSEKIDTLTDEVELLRVLAGTLDVHLVSQCDRAGWTVSLSANPIGLPGFRPIDQFIPRIMPWQRPSDGQEGAVRLRGEANGMVTTTKILFERKADYFYDFFIVLRASEQTEATDRRYADIENASLKNADGAIVSSTGHPSCTSAMVINWQGKFEHVGIFRTGPVDPVIHVRRMGFLRDYRIVYPPEDRPKIEDQIAKELCGRYASYCPLAMQHAQLRMQGRNPWNYESLDATIFAGPAPRPTPRPVSPVATPEKLAPEASQRDGTAVEPRNRPPPPPPRP